MLGNVFISVFSVPCTRKQLFSCYIKQIQNAVTDCYEALNNPLDYPETIIPIEKANADFLFLVSQDDRNWKSEVYADIAIKLLEKAGRKNCQVSVCTVNYQESVCTIYTRLEGEWLYKTSSY